MIKACHVCRQNNFLQLFAFELCSASVGWDKNRKTSPIGCLVLENERIEFFRKTFFLSDFDCFYGLWAQKVPKCQNYVHPLYRSVEQVRASKPRPFIRVEPPGSWDTSVESSRFYGHLTIVTPLVLGPQTHDGLRTLCILFFNTSEKQSLLATFDQNYFSAN